MMVHPLPPWGLPRSRRPESRHQRLLLRAVACAFLIVLAAIRAHDDRCFQEDGAGLCFLHAQLRCRRHTSAMRAHTSPASSKLEAKSSHGGNGTAVPAKADRPKVVGVQWGSLKPLPFLLWGKVDRNLQAVVERISETGITVRLLWEVVVEGKRITEPSPIRGFIDHDAFSSVFQTYHERYLTRCRTGVFPLQVNQSIGVQVRAGTVHGKRLLLSLSPKQPRLPYEQKLSPFVVETCPFSSLEPFLREHRLRVVGAMKRAVGAVQPPQGWEDPLWKGWLTGIVQVTKGIPPLVAAAWSVADGSRDLVVSGPMKPAERALLYVLPLLRHLRQYPHPPNPHSFQAIILAEKELAEVMAYMLSRLGVNVAHLHSANSKGQDWQLRKCQVAILDPAQTNYKAVRRTGWLHAISYISFLAVDNLDSMIKSEKIAVRNFKRLLPDGDWGPSIVSLRRWSPQAEKDLAAFVRNPLTLRSADSAYEAEVVHSVVDKDELITEAASVGMRHYHQRVLVFTADPQKLAKILQGADTSSRLATGDNFKKRSAVLVVASSGEPWEKYDLFDIVVLTDAPPSMEEYHRRLAICTRKAYAIVGREKYSLKMDNSWLPYIEAKDWDELEAVGARSVFQDPSTSNAPLEDRGATFQDDYSLGSNGEIIWNAGEEVGEGEEEFAAFTDML